MEDLEENEDDILAVREIQKKSKSLTKERKKTLRDEIPPEQIQAAEKIIKGFRALKVNR